MDQSSAAQKKKKAKQRKLLIGRSEDKWVKRQALRVAGKGLASGACKYGFSKESLESKRRALDVPGSRGTVAHVTSSGG